MFDRQQLSPLHTVRRYQPDLRPDIMRRQHVERLRRRDAEKRAGGWQSAWQGIMQFAELLAVHVGNKLRRRVAERKLRPQSERL